MYINEEIPSDLIFVASAWAEKRLNKIRRNFFWNADEEGNGGKMLG